MNDHSPDTIVNFSIHIGTYVGRQKFLAVVKAGYAGFALRDKVVVANVVGQQQCLYGRAIYSKIKTHAGTRVLTIFCGFNF